MGPIPWGGGGGGRAWYIYIYIYLSLYIYVYIYTQAIVTFVALYSEASQFLLPATWTLTSTQSIQYLLNG